jgi:hypothetical protein
MPGPHRFARCSRARAGAVCRTGGTRGLTARMFTGTARGASPVSVAMWARICAKVWVAEAARRGFEPLRASRTPLMLGRCHPLSPMVTLVRVLAWQMAAAAAAVAVGAFAVAGRRGWGIGLLCAALVAELVLVLLCTLARQLGREHLLRLIAGGCARRPVEEISRQAQRLVTPRHRAQLAERLERALDEAVRWHQLPVASRPPPAVRLLWAFAPEVGAIVEQLRTGQPAVPGVALLELSLTGGYGSAVYAGDSDLLREQLWRILSLICPAASAEGWPWG